MAVQRKEEHEPAHASDDADPTPSLSADDGPTPSLNGDRHKYDPEQDNLTGRPLFGGYVVGNCIGIGGMGAVYEAENLELGTRLAVKVLHPAMSADPQMTTRFLAEARAASAIKHKNIIEILDASRLPDGRAYILMEYLEGETLRDHLSRFAPLSISNVLAIILQACSGLEAAHGRGIVHRDLKPANLFVTTQQDTPLTIKILDFGIAKLTDEKLARDMGTQANAVVGTPNYMSPEQARALRTIDHRADIYSLGVIAFELLTNTLPYNAHSVGELVFQLAHSKLPTVRELRSDVPAEWNALVRRAMALDASERFQTVREMADAMIRATPQGIEIARRVAPALLTPADATPPPGSTVDWSGEVSWRGHARKQRIRALMTASLMLALGATATAGWLALRSPPADSRTSEARSATPVDVPPVIPASPSPPQQIEVPPAPQTARVRVVSDPAGASIYVDDALQPTPAPIEFERPIGVDITIRAELDGYQPAVQHVRAEAGMERVLFQLSRRRAVRPAKGRSKAAGATTEPTRPRTDDELFDMRN